MTARTSSTPGSRLRRPFVAAAVALGLCSAAGAQVKSRPVGAGSGPLSEMSTNVRSGGGPVSGDGGTLRESSADRVGGASVRGSTTGTITSGPVSDASVGPVRARRPPVPPPVEIPDGEYFEPEADAGRPPLPEADVDDEEAEVDDDGEAEAVQSLEDLRVRLREVQPLPRQVAKTQAPKSDDASAVAGEDSDPVAVDGTTGEGADESAGESAGEEPEEPAEEATAGAEPPPGR